MHVSTKYHNIMFFQKLTTCSCLFEQSQGLNTEKFDVHLEKLISTTYVPKGTNETFSLSGFVIHLERSATPFLVNTYLPTSLLTIASFMGFLIPVEKVPGRMALLVTIFLMLVNISSTERMRGPVVS